MSKWTHIPMCSGVYRGFYGNECLYVGSTVNLRKRIMSHELRRKCDRWEWEPVSEGNLIITEQAHINQYRPVLNRARAYHRGAARVRSIARAMSLDEDVLRAFDQFCAQKKERPTAVVQRMMIEAMKRAGCWPPPMSERSAGE